MAVPRIMRYLKLSGPYQTEIPIMGLGTWRAQPQEVENAVIAALDAGYRLIGDRH